jgi:hypothetical protein
LGLIFVGPHRFQKRKFICDVKLALATNHKAKLICVGIPDNLPLNGYFEWWIWFVDTVRNVSNSNRNCSYCWPRIEGSKMGRRKGL